MAGRLNFLVQNPSSSNSVTTSVEDETKNGAEFLVIIRFNTKKWLSSTIKQFPTLDKENFESLSLIPDKILHYGALDPIKDSIPETLAS